MRSESLLCVALVRTRLKALTPKALNPVRAPFCGAPQEACGAGDPSFAQCILSVAFGGGALTGRALNTLEFTEGVLLGLLSRRPQGPAYPASAGPPVFADELRASSYRDLELTAGSPQVLRYPTLE